jgi:hypothetical protein
MAQSSSRSIEYQSESPPQTAAEKNEYIVIGAAVPSAAAEAE